MAHFYIKLNNKNLRYINKRLNKIIQIEKLGIGDWGLGIGPNPQSPIPNPQSPNYFIFNIKK